MSGRIDGGVRAEPARLEHRHRRAHAEGARDVAGGADDAAIAAADDQRLVGEARIVALLDRGIEGVAIDVADGKRIELGVTQHARREAARAAGDTADITAGNRGRKRPSRHLPFPDCAQRRARALDLGRIDALLRGRRRPAAVRCRKSDRARRPRNSASRAAARISCRADAGCGEEPAKMLRFRGEERQRRDGEALRRPRGGRGPCCCGSCRLSWGCDSLCSLDLSNPAAAVPQIRVQMAGLSTAVRYAIPAAPGACLSANFIGLSWC